MSRVKSLILRLMVTVAIALALSPGAAPALAHAIVVNTDPVDGAVLSGAPQQVRLWFSEPVLLKFTTAELTDSDGQTVPLLNVRLDPADPKLLIADLPDLPPNAYRLTWRTLSSDDLHASAGAVVFGLGQAAEVAAAPPAAVPAVPEVVTRWLNFTALAGIVGALAMVVIILPGAVRDRDASNQFRGLDAFSADLFSSVRRRLLWLGLGSAIAALLVGLGLLFIQAGEASGVNNVIGRLNEMWQIVAGTDYGIRWLQHQALLIGVIVAVAFLLRRTLRYTYRQLLRNNRLELLALTPLALALIVTQSLNSHAAGLEGAPLLKVSVDALHLLSASLWSGGLAALAVTVLPLLRRSGPESALAWSVLKHFGLLAALSVVVIILTGLYNTGQQVASLDALLVTFYGQSLMLKVGLMLGVGALGLLNSALLHPRLMAVMRRALRRPSDWSPLAPAQLWRTVLVEALGAGLVLLVAAVLTATQPARGPEFDPPLKDEVAASTTVTAAADDLIINLSIKPNRPGQNFINLGVFNTRRPAPAPIEAVAVQMRAPNGRTLTRTAAPLENGRYQIAGGDLDAEGQWQITVSVSRQNLPDAKLDAPWVVGSLLRSSARRPVLISNTPLSPILTSLVAGLLALVVGTCLWVWWKGRAGATAAISLVDIRPAIRLLRKE